MSCSNGTGATFGAAGFGQGLRFAPHLRQKSESSVNQYSLQLQVAPGRCRPHFRQNSESGKKVLPQMQVPALQKAFDDELIAELAPDVCLA